MKDKSHLGTEVKFLDLPRPYRNDIGDSSLNPASFWEESAFTAPC